MKEVGILEIIWIFNILMIIYLAVVIIGGLIKDYKDGARSKNEFDWTYEMDELEPGGMDVSDEMDESEPDETDELGEMDEPIITEGEFIKMLERYYQIEFEPDDYSEKLTQEFAMAAICEVAQSLGLDDIEWEDGEPDAYMTRSEADYLVTLFDELL